MEFLNFFLFLSTNFLLRKFSQNRMSTKHPCFRLISLSCITWSLINKESQRSCLRFCRFVKAFSKIPSGMACPLSLPLSLSTKELYQANAFVVVRIDDILERNELKGGREGERVCLDTKVENKSHPFSISIDLLQQR